MARTISWDEAVDAYTAMVEPTFDVQSTLTALQAGQLAREAQVVVELVRVREFVSREDALVAGARAAGKLTDRQYDTLTATIEDRRVFHRTYVADLPDDSRQLFTDFEQSDGVPGADRGRGRPAAGGRVRCGQGHGRRLLAHHDGPRGQAVHAAVHPSRRSTPPTAAGPSPTARWSRPRSSVCSD